MTLTTARELADVDALVARLLSADRRVPHCVVTTQPGTTTPLIDASALAADCGTVGDVTLVPTGPLTWRLAELLPDHCAVWGGAGRVYPVGTDWRTAPLSSPLRFAYSAADAGRARERLLEDVLAMAASGGWSTPMRPATTVQRAEVQGVTAGGMRALVRLTDGRTGTVAPLRLLPDVPFDWFVGAGLEVPVATDASSERLELVLAATDEHALLRHFEAGTVTVALVSSTARQEAVLHLHPAVPVHVRRTDVSSNPRDLVSQLLGEGEVVAVRIVRDPQGRLRLRLDDVEDDDEPVPAVPLVEGGPPWLVAGRDLVARDPAVPNLAVAADLLDDSDPPPAEPLAPPHRPVPGPGRAAALTEPVPLPPSLHQTLLQLEAARAEVRRLRSGPPARQAGGDSALALELSQEHARSVQLRSELAEARRELSELRKRVRGAGSGRRSPLADRDRFDDADEWIRHEVTLTWIERLGPEERRIRRVDEGWTIGTRFVASLGGLSDSLLRKVFRTVVDVVTGLDSELDGRELHPLRSGLGGDDPPVTRDHDGAMCWRVAVERNAPSAKRLHYWRGREGVELARVVVHDDFRP